MDEPEDIGTSSEDASPDSDVGADSGVAPDGVFNGPSRDLSQFSWRDVNPRRAALLALVLVGALALVAWGVSGLVGSDDEPDTANTPEATDTPTPGSSDSASETPDASDEATEPVHDEGDEDPTTTPVNESDFSDAGLVAFRLGRKVWIAREDGTRQRFVADLRVGAYALSPDGKTLALVDATTMTLAIVEIDSGERREVGEALASAPVWSPDSEWVLFARSGAEHSEVWRVSADGDELSRVAVGHSAHVAADAKRFAVVTRDRFGDDDRAILPLPVVGEPDSLVEVADRVIDFAWDGQILAHALQDDAGKSRILVGTMDDPEERTLVRPLAGVAFRVGYQQLALSPDGRLLAYTAAGDDGYSRLFVVPVAGGTPKELTMRRDAYLVRWSRDGAYLLFIEGNQFQGEDTRLMRVRPDGMGRETLVEGAGL